MEQLLDLLTSYGLWGMFIAAFLAGSILPFSSEAVMVALLAVGISPWLLLLYASLGNSLGGVTCYYIGRLTTPERVQRLFRINPRHMERARRLVLRWGALMGFFCWVPILGDAILVTLGIMRSNALVTNLMMLLGRTLRYATVLLSALGIGHLFFS
ncbi:MAG: DedA family protein [Bacteroidaceae bacterium]|nr:DedA family protein [Bacteroidaceae bacterium]